MSWYRITSLENESQQSRSQRYSQFLLTDKSQCCVVLDKSLVSKSSYEAQAWSVNYVTGVIHHISPFAFCSQRRHFLPATTSSGHCAIISGHVFVKRKYREPAGGRRCSVRGASDSQQISIQRFYIGNRLKRLWCSATCYELPQHIRPFSLSWQLTSHKPDIRITHEPRSRKGRHKSTPFSGAAFSSAPLFRTISIWDENFCRWK